jgi:hypothetical protein
MEGLKARGIKTAEVIDFLLRKWAALFGNGEWKRLPRPLGNGAL